MTVWVHNIFTEWGTVDGYSVLSLEPLLLFSMPFWTRATSTGLTAETHEPCSCSGATPLHPGIRRRKLSNDHIALYRLLQRVHSAQTLRVLQDRVLSLSMLGIIARHLQAWMPTSATKPPP